MNLEQTTKRNTKERARKPRKSGIHIAMLVSSTTSKNINIALAKSTAS